jgi:polysaccharide biosynthesis/export protein
LGDDLGWLFEEGKDPGPYLAAPGTTLGELVQMAGGPLRTADLSAVEVTSTSINAANGTARTIRTEYKGTIDDFRRVTLQPLDVVRFRPVFSDRQEGRVTITGEVRYPGTFDVKRGERLSEVLARAGGLTNEAYAMGSIFTRRSAAISESEANQREAKELQVALAAAAQRGSFTSNVSGASIAGAGGAGGATASDVVNNLIAELRSAPALGRITVTADPAVLQVNPELDIPLEGGDTLYIPKRPSTVTVSGEVLNTGSFAYRNDLTVKDYIAMAGGTRETADDGRTFVVLPDGSARPVEDGWLNFSSNNLIPPGSTIVVPVAVAPFNFLTTLGNIAALTQVTSQLAITAVSLKLLGQ